MSPGLRPCELRQYGTSDDEETRLTLEVAEQMVSRTDNTKMEIKQEQPDLCEIKEEMYTCPQCCVPILGLDFLHLHQTMVHGDRFRELVKQEVEVTSNMGNVVINMEGGSSVEVKTRDDNLESEMSEHESSDSSVVCPDKTADICGTHDMMRAQNGNCQIESSKELSLSEEKAQLHGSDTSYKLQNNSLDGKHINIWENEFKCDICGWGFSDSSNLREHEKIHKVDKSYKCDVCGVGFSRSDALKRHKRIHTGEKPYKCDICGQAFAQQSNLLIHTRIHSREKPYKCDVCGQGFALTSYLIRHTRTHTREKPYKCDVCDQEFALKRYLIRHSKIHTGEKPYKCDVCGQGYFHESYLVNHARIHTGDKPFECEVCGQTFALKSYLNKHNRIHTREKPKKSI